MCGEKKRKDCIFYFLLVFVLCLPHMQKKKEKKKKKVCEDRLINPYADKGGTLQILAQTDYIAQPSYISKSTG